MIKIIILYFVQIIHANDFPSTGTRLVLEIGAVGCNVIIIGVYRWILPKF